MKISLSVVIPAYNEEANIARCIASVAAVLQVSDWDWEIIIVNDGSRDRTSDVAKATVSKLKLPHTQVVNNTPNRGYGGSLKRGFAAATKDFIAFIPADNQFDFSEIHTLLATQAATGAAIVSGIRPRGGHDPWPRLIIRWAWNTLVRALFGYLASDIDCGFKLFRRSILSRVHIPSDGAMIDTQLLAGARARGLTVAEVEVLHLPRTAGSPTGGNLKVWIKAWRELAAFWWQLRHEILVEKGLAVFRWEALIILVILILGGFFRLFRIGDYMTFLGDEGRDAAALKDIVDLRHFPAIGPGTSIGNMYLGPWYYYLTAPALKLFNYSPVGPAVMVSAIGLATIALMWWIGRQWFGRKEALVVAGLYAISPIVIIYSRSSWNPNIMPFFALICIYGIWKVWRLGYWRWLIITAVSLAIVLNSHYLGLLLLPVLGLFWLLAFRRRASTPIAVRATVLAILSFGIFMSPLVIYDLRHHGQNMAAVAKFFTDRQTTVNFKAYKALPNLWPIWTDITSSLLTASQEPVGSKVALFLIASSAVVLALNPSPHLGLVLVWVAVGLVGLGLYKQHIYAHYFGFLFPAPFMLLGFTLSYLNSSRLLRLVGVILLLLLVVINLRFNPLLTPPNYQLDRTQEISRFVDKSAGGQPYNLALISKNNYDASYRYLLSLLGSPVIPIRHPQTGEFQLTDQLFVICESLPCQPVGHPLSEIAAFGWAKVDYSWDFPWGVSVYRLVHNPSGQ